MNLGIGLILLIPLLPLMAAALIFFSRPEAQHRRATLGVIPFAAAFVCSVVTLVFVTSRGSIDIRFYDPSAAWNLILPLGMHVDRLSAVMMVLISLVGTIIYRYSVNYM